MCKMTLSQIKELDANDLHKLAQKGAGLSLPKGWPWSPLTNDGDAYRLMSIVVSCMNVDDRLVHVTDATGEHCVVVLLQDYVLPHDGGINKGRAIREAIVFLAALIGANK